MRHKLLIFIIIFLFFFFTSSGNIDSIDATSHMYLAKQMVLHGRIDYGQDKLAQKMVASINKNDRNYYIVYNFGYALFLIPGVLLSSGIRTLLHAPTSLFPSQYDFIYIWYANLLNGAVIILISFLIVKMVLRLKPELKNKKNLTTLLFFCVFGTNMVVQGHQQFAHPLFTLFAMLSFFKLWDYGEKNTVKNLFLFSLFFGITASIYNTTFILLIPAFIIYYCFIQKNNKRNIRKYFFLFISFLPALGIQLLWNYLRFGSPFLTGYLELGFKVYEFNPIENLKNFIAMTIAPNKGLFFNNPILSVSFFIAIKEALTKRSSLKVISLFYLILAATYLLNYSFATIWHGESAYGPRYLFILVPFGIMFFLLYVYQLKTRWKHWIIVVLMIFGFFIQIPGLLIPHFTFPHISKPYCIKPNYRYFDLRCSPLIVGWAQLIKRETKTAKLIFQNGPLITNRYPNPLKPFKTIYPDPLFNIFSKYKTNDYIINEDLLNNLYAFSPDIWWIKLQYYKNILP